MEVLLSPEFSFEFSFQESSITTRFEEELAVFFKNKNYGSFIKRIYIGVTCVSKNFESEFKIRKPKMLKNKSAIEYELKLDFDKFKESDELQRKCMLAQEILSKSKEVFLERAMDGFDDIKLIQDLESYFQKKGYLEEKIV
ncbi:Imm44 family immunity protein [Hyunsoonleella ulvae]|uniref:Imm44 family immunity protein n=1 Tax=Hyunsoonleella ulvae TaxID=2799948 RepID=UPI00193A8894|nr:Imm44 family immunity protein [Hyunsoonleella ulvae]